MAYRKIKKDGKPAQASRPLKLDDETFIRITNEYIKHCQDAKIVPLKQELAIMLGISEDTLARYSKLSRRAELIKRVEKLSELGWVRYAETTNKPIFPIFMLKAQHGYIEQQYSKTDINITGLGGLIQLPPKKSKEVLK